MSADRELADKRITFAASAIRENRLRALTVYELVLSNELKAAQVKLLIINGRRRVN